MRRLVYAIYGLTALSLGCSDERSKVMDTPKEATITREALIAHGFKESTSIAGAFVAENVRLASIAAQLGFDRANLYPVPGQSRWSDVRRVTVRGVTLVVESMVNDANGRIVGVK